MFHALCLLVQEKTKKKAPYNQYDGLEQKGVKIQWGSPSDSSAIPSGDFDIVYDNNGKDMDACKPLIDAFKVYSYARQATPQLVGQGSTVWYTTVGSVTAMHYTTL